MPNRLLDLLCLVGASACFSYAMYYAIMTQDIKLWAWWWILGIILVKNPFKPVKDNNERKNG